MPGIPENLGNAEVLYRHPSGFYIGPNAQYADNYNVDFANTEKADAYTIWGMRAGIDFAEKYSVFFEARNLTDKKWVSNTGVVPNATSGARPAAVYNPGYDRNFFFGFSADFDLFGQS